MKPSQTEIELLEGRVLPEDHHGDKLADEAAKLGTERPENWPRAWLPTPEPPPKRRTLELPAAPFEVWPQRKVGEDSPMSRLSQTSAVSYTHLTLPTILLV
eukprot:2515-Amphidinium_carterae.1